MYLPLSVNNCPRIVSGSGHHHHDTRLCTVYCNIYHLDSGWNRLDSPSLDCAFAHTRYGTYSNPLCSPLPPTTSGKMMMSSSSTIPPPPLPPPRSPPAHQRHHCHQIHPPHLLSHPLLPPHRPLTSSSTHRSHPSVSLPSASITFPHIVRCECGSWITPR